MLFNKSLEWLCWKQFNKIIQQNQQKTQQSKFLRAVAEASRSLLCNHNQGEAEQRHEPLSRTKEIMLRGSERGSVWAQDLTWPQRLWTWIGRYGGGEHMWSRETSQVLCSWERLSWKQAHQEDLCVSSGVEEPQKVRVGRVKSEKALGPRGRMLSAGLDHRVM